MARWSNHCWRDEPGLITFLLSLRVTLRSDTLRINPIRHGFPCICRYSDEAPAMARMTREFSLVLLGAGLLTAGYFLWPEEDPIKIANEQDAVAGGNGGSRGRAGIRHVVFLHGIGGRSATVSPTSSVRGGFGRGGSGFGG